MDDSDLVLFSPNDTILKIVTKKIKNKKIKNKVWL